QQLKDQLAMIMGGYVVERKIYGEDSVSTGPSNDLSKATEIASKMIKRYGMSESLAPRSYGENDDESEDKEKQEKNNKEDDSKSERENK
ncbi:MAG: hypothetical protein BRC22_00810, partial [Parcubacteria group bacterium QH_9_35_7]